jgi:penicillin amidase
MPPNARSIHSVPGLDHEVTIARDEWGIPHVRATSAHDAFFGQGFVQAADRLGQLEYDRRRAHGRWAEVAGPSAVTFDVFARRCGLAAAAAREVAALDPDARAVLDAFAAGVNAYLALDLPLPRDLALVDVRPEPWSAADCSAVFLVRHVVFANWQKKLWRGRLVGLLGAEAVVRLEGADPRSVPLIVPPPASMEPHGADPEELTAVVAAMAELAEPAAGSNAWALHGTRTASGLPLVAGDPHRALEVPGVYAQGHLACEEFDAIGLSFVGIPGFPHFGHNARVAWCVTNANGDYQDLFVEDPAAVERTGTEEVLVRGRAPVEIECFESAHGPVVFGDPARGAVLALASTALVEPSSGLSVLAPMLRAEDVDALDAVMAAWVDPVNNLVSADVGGDIAYRTVGRIPVRDPSNAWGPVSGSGEAHDWHGVVAHADLPRVKNPEGGLVITANQRIVGEEYPHHLGVDYARPDRARRLHDRLHDLHEATVDDMAAVHRDRVSLAADVWVPRLLGLTPRDDWERRALAALGDWDRSMDPDSVGAALYVVTRDAACRLLAHHPDLVPLRLPFADEPAGTFQPLELRLWALSTGLLAADDTTLVPSGWTSTLADALTDAVAVLRTALGDDVGAWQWGALHRAAPRHPLSALHPDWAGQLDPPSVAIGGEWDTVMCAAHPAGHGFGVTSTSVARYVFDLADWDASAWVVPLGASGEPTDRHFADQQPAWSVGDLVPMRYSWAGIEAGATSLTVLSSPPG